MSGNSGNNFPALGFNPAPGDAEAVFALSEQLSKAVASLQEGHQLIANLSNSSSEQWQGEASDAFRSHLSDKLPKALANAHDSLAKAQQALSGWGNDLVAFQASAVALEAQAEQEKAQVDQAQANYQQAQQNPNLGFFSEFNVQLSPEQIQAAGDARAQLLQCEAQLQEYQAQLQATIRRAQELEQDHHQMAGQVAEALHSAPDGLAPHKPGWFHSAMNWLHSHAKVIGNVLSALSAVAGVLALIPPLTVVCAPLAAGLSLAAFGMQAWGGDHNLLDLGGDLLGAVPGIGVFKDAAFGVKAATTGLNVAEDAAKAGGLGSKLFTPIKAAWGSAKDFVQPAVDLYKDIAQPAATAAGKLQAGGTLANFAAHLAMRVPTVGGLFEDTATATKALSLTIDTVMKAHSVDSHLTKAMQGAQ